MILVCTATRAEHDACARGASSLEHLLVGVGAANAAQALIARLTSDGPRPALVVSTGFAGALRPGLDVGTWVTASSLSGGAADLRRAPAPAVPVAFLSSDVLVQGSVTDHGEAEAVDMESVALSRIAAEHRIPLMVLRLISDTPENPLPTFLGGFTAGMAATTSRGKLNGFARGLRGVLKNPRGVARVVREGVQWTRDLESGWRSFAPTLSAEHSVPVPRARSS